MNPNDRQIGECMTEQTLIATVGSEPQVVTLVLDLLLSRGYPIKKVILDSDLAKL